MTAIKTILFMLLVPGLLLGALPAWLMLTNKALFSFGLFRWLAVPLWLIGLVVMLWCAWNFTVVGRGTPAPLDPPKELVANGLYRYVRNPMYDGAILILLGHMLWFPSLSLILSPVIFFATFHLFVVLYEERHLRKVFGGQYEDYYRKVPRWIPRLK